MGRSTHRISKAQLARARDQFVQAWGQMGPSWGISRTMAEVHALLYIVGEPLNTDEVMERLQISRGNASMSMRALVEWGLVSRVHKRGDRKEYFEADQDVWSIARTIIRERMRREILPLLASLHELRDETGEHAQAGGAAGIAGADEAVEPARIAEHNKRLDKLVELVQTIDRLGERFVGSEGAGGKGLQLAATLLSKVV
jgi:DNA-binding transcriptional regulator GbsR (MarR family)